MPPPIVVAQTAKSNDTIEVAWLAGCQGEAAGRAGRVLDFFRFTRGLAYAGRRQPSAAPAAGPGLTQGGPASDRPSPVRDPAGPPGRRGTLAALRSDEARQALANLSMPLCKIKEIKFFFKKMVS